VLSILRTDQAIFSGNRAVSVMLRLAQFKLLASKENAKEIAACVEALLREAGEEPDAINRGLFEPLALASILLTIGIASSVPN